MGRLRPAMPWFRMAPLPQAGGTGDVVGPAAGTDNALARFDGTTGKLIQNSSVILSDSPNGNLSPGTSDDVALGTTTKMWSDLFLAAGAVINFNNGDVLITHSTNTLAFSGASSGYTFDAVITNSVAGNNISLTNSTDSSSVQVALLQGDRATVATNDEAYASLMISDGAGTQIEIGRMTWALPTTTAGAASGRLDFSVRTAGTLAKELQLSGADLSPSANDGLALGTTSLMFSDLFLASGGVINFNNGNVTLTHSAGVLTSNVPLTANSFIPTSSSAPSNGMYLSAANTLAWAINSAAEISLTSTVFSPTSSDGNALGSTTLMWADLFLASGGVINFNNGDITLTHATASLTLAGGPLILAENSSIQLDPAGSADGKYTGITMTGVGGAVIAFGDLLYLDAATSRWKLTDADAAATSDRMLGIAVTTSSDGGALTILLVGNIRADAKFPALTIGSAVYVGETAGEIQVAIPTGADNVIRRVGYALTADEIYFCPSMDSQTTVA